MRRTPTDTEIMEWLQREGLESVHRIPQFTKHGESAGFCLWGSLWRPGEVFLSMRSACIIGMHESAKPTTSEVTM